MLAIIGALELELSGLTGRMSVEQASTREGCHIRTGTCQGKALLLAFSGMGKERAEFAARTILEGYDVSALVSVGFTGALRNDLNIGDIILGSQICCQESGSGQEELSNSTCRSDSSLASVAIDSNDKGFPKATLGKIVSVDRMVSSRSGKHALAASSGADAVDMESYWIARMAHNKNVPFLGIRAVSDRLDDRLVPVDKALDRDGGWLWPQAAAVFIRPDYLVGLLGMYSKSRRAGKSLAGYLGRLLTRL